MVKINALRGITERGSVFCILLRHKINYYYPHDANILRISE